LFIKWSRLIFISKKVHIRWISEIYFDWTKNGKILNRIIVRSKSPFSFNNLKMKVQMIKNEKYKHQEIFHPWLKKLNFDRRISVEYLFWHKIQFQMYFGLTRWGAHHHPGKAEGHCGQVVMASDWEYEGQGFKPWWAPPGNLWPCGLPNKITNNSMRKGVLLMKRKISKVY